MKYVSVKLHPQFNSSRVDLIRWIRNTFAKTDNGYSLNNAMQIADSLLEGETFRYDGAVLIKENPYCIMSIEDDEIVEPEVHLEKVDYYKMMKEGANGDTMSAIKFCQAAVEGKVCFAAYAGG